MHEDRTPATFLTRWRRAWRPALGPDPADYGTAFGLDLSMEEGLPQAAKPAEPVRATRWLPRWWRGA